MNFKIVPILVFVLLLISFYSEGQLYPALPAGKGISAFYPKDQNIEENKSVLFHDDFENRAALEHWDQTWANQGEHEVVFTGSLSHSGKGSYKSVMIRPALKSSSVGIRKFLEPGYDTLFFRYYAMYAPETELFHGSTHNAGSISARLPGELHESYAGIYPDGKNMYTIVLDTWRPDSTVRSPGNIAFYTYHMDQGHEYGDHFFPSGQILPGGRDLFGKGFIPRRDFIPESGKWYCYEMMVIPNSPGKRNGRIAFWIDGELKGDFSNLRFREIENLKPNRVGFGLYTDNPKVDKNVTMWFDDVVVSTKYIGPMAD